MGIMEETPATFLRMSLSAREQQLLRILLPLKVHSGLIWNPFFPIRRVALGGSAEKIASSKVGVLHYIWRHSADVYSFISGV